MKNDAGEVIELLCTYDPETRGGANPTDGRKVKATIHWVSARHAFEPAEVRLYDRLFSHDNPDTKKRNFLDHINEESFTVLTNAKLEPSLAEWKPGDSVQFERVGYFCADDMDFEEGKPVFNRTVGLRDSWAKVKSR